MTSKEVVLITGCNKGGIGYYYAQKFAAEGYHVVATNPKYDGMEGLEAHGCQKEELDITEHNSIEKVVDKILAEHSHIDILVNNAGIPAVAALLDIDPETVRQCLEINIMGALALIQAVGPHMAERRKGKIVNVGSMVGYAATPWAGIYCLSKAAIHNMSDALRLEMKPFNVQVICVVPGSVKSKFGVNGLDKALVPKDSIYKPVSDDIYGRATMSSGDDATAPEKFADHVVNQIIKKNPPKYITYASSSWKFLLFYYLPVFIKDFFLYRMFNVISLENQKSE